MPKTNITEYSSTPSSNTDINNINIDENCPASGLNNAIRELMAHLKNVDTGSQALTALSVTGDLTVDTNTLYVDSANNRVGVGTASPNANTKLDVNGAARIGNSTDGIMIENNTGSFDIDNASYIRRDSSSGALEITSGSTTARNMIFNTKTSGAESARIDSSGNLLVGTTNANPAENNVAGIGALANNTLSITRDGSAAMQLNRKTSDGSIAIFRKEGNTVGAISTFSDTLQIGSYVGNDAFIQFVSSGIKPVNSAGTNRDNGIDLGASNARFKDLYLGGGVYLGGTGSANKLDDYEEGTWTPNIGGNATYTNQTAQYVKVGDLVHIQCNIEINTIGTGSANTLSGLPFTSFNNSHVQTVNIAYYSSIATSMIWLSGYIENHNTTIKFSGNTTSNTTIQHNTHNVFQNNARIILTATYRTS